jgi:hypothetical protein
MLGMLKRPQKICFLSNEGHQKKPSWVLEMLMF